MGIASERSTPCNAPERVLPRDEAEFERNKERLGSQRFVKWTFIRTFIRALNWTDVGIVSRTREFGLGRDAVHHPEIGVHGREVRSIFAPDNSRPCNAPERVLRRDEADSERNKERLGGQRFVKRTFIRTLIGTLDRPNMDLISRTRELGLGSDPDCHPEVGVHGKEI